jgi:hypothetical protein
MYKKLAKINRIQNDDPTWQKSFGSYRIWIHNNVVGTGTYLGAKLAEILQSLEDLKPVGMV